MYSWQAGIITFLVIWHFLGCAYSLYVHRGLGHRYFTFTPILEHFFRFYLWMCIGFSYHNWMQHWAAKHRKHHRYSDTSEDPNSPRYYTLWQLCDVSHNDSTRANYISPEEVEYYAPDIKTTDDWVERNVYVKHRKAGMAILWAIFVIFFGWAGIVLGASIYYFSQFLGIVFGNYLIHKIGFTYAGNRGQDQSKILCPIGIFFGGEEIHSHHHNDPSKPYFHRHWWEIDISWVYARVLIFFRLMKLNSRYL